MSNHLLAHEPMQFHQTTSYGEFTARADGSDAMYLSCEHAVLNGVAYHVWARLEFHAGAWRFKDDTQYQHFDVTRLNADYSWRTSTSRVALRTMAQIVLSVANSVGDDHFRHLGAQHKHASSVRSATAEVERLERELAEARARLAALNAAVSAGV